MTLLCKMEATVNEVFAELKEELGINFDLHEEQMKIICGLLRKEDVCAVLPTGFGKSLIFALLPLIKDRIQPENKPHIALVVSPLRALMKHQQTRWSAKGVPTGCILPWAEMTEDDRKAIMDGRLSLLFTSPEAVLSLDNPWRGMLRKEHFRKHICLLAFDEAHCITNWGEDFRKSYSQVGELRSMLGDVATLILSATLPSSVREAVLKTLHLDPSTVQTVARNPDRPNIFIKYAARVQRDDSVMQAIEEPQWLTDYVAELKRDGCKARKAIIYCRYINTVSHLWGYIMNALESSAWIEADSRNATDRIIDMYHSSLDTVSQDRVVKAFTSDGTLRCVVATIAFGMGVDVPDVRMIFHWGLSKNLIDYWQEVGRCSRDGQAGMAVLYPAPLRGHIQTDRAFKDIVASFGNQHTCIRQAVLSSLWLPEMGSKPSETKIACGNRCGVKCQCSRCICCSVCKASCQCQKM